MAFIIASRVLTSCKFVSESCEFWFAEFWLTEFWLADGNSFSSGSLMDIFLTWFLTDWSGDWSADWSSGWSGDWFTDGTDPDRNDSLLAFK